LAFLSNGAVTKSATLQRFTPASWNGWPQPGITQALRWGSYSHIYRRQLWVSVLVNKIANASARLPLKVYERDELNRPEARDTPYAELLRNPNSELDPYLFWLWTVSTLNIYGEAFWLKVRDRGGRPVQLVPWHPTRMVDDSTEGRRQWFLQRDDGRTSIDRRDFVHFRFYDPDSLHRGMSPLEPLRDTLENEAGARAANSAMWRHGGRPSFVLRHPGKFSSDAALLRLRDQWNDIHGGVNNWGKTAILEEGMEAQKLTFDADELQYIESRKLNREEACAAYDVPPPVVHILDRATFSNITEQMRSMYRDTMAPKLKLLESTIETELRDGRFGAQGEPDFGSNVYAEFLMDEVLRGDFEARAAAYQQADYMTLAEKRRSENLPYIEGTDRIFLNAASLPLTADGTLEQPTAMDPTQRARSLAEILQKLSLSVGTVITDEEARRLMEEAGMDLDADGLPAPEVLPASAVRSVMGRLSRPEHLAEVDPIGLVRDLNGCAKTVLLELEQAHAKGLTVAEFRDRLRTLEAR
jgi:HK97 family phage portal protein